MLKALRFFGWPLLAGVLIAMLIIQRYPQWVGLPSLDVNLQQAPQTSYVQQGPVTYADAVVRAAPAVANLYTTKMVSKSSHPLLEDPVFRRFFGDNLPKQKRWESSLGSAVIMSPEGYLLTNNHVINQAQKINVQLNDGSVWEVLIIHPNKFSRPILKNEKNELMSKLGYTWKDIFPIVYSTKIKCNGEYYNGLITDFNEGR
mgnify:CR=1 FL=1